MLLSGPYSPDQLKNPPAAHSAACLVASGAILMRSKVECHASLTVAQFAFLWWID